MRAAAARASSYRAFLPSCGPALSSHSTLRGGGIGLARLKTDRWIEGVGPGTRLEIALREPRPWHQLTVQQVLRWVDGVTTSPAEVLRRARVKRQLGSVLGNLRRAKRVAA